MASNLKINVVSLPAEDETLVITNTTTGQVITFVFKTPPVSFTPSSIAIGTTIDEQVLILETVLNNVYNALGVYTISSDLALNLVEIIPNAPNETAQFTETTNTTGGAITTTISNDTPASAFTIDDVVISEATDACNDVDIELTLSEQGDNLTAPIAEAISSNPHNFTTSRANEIDIQATLGSNSARQGIRIPKLLTTYLDVEVFGSPSGALVTVNRLYPLTNLGPESYPLALTFEYALDTDSSYPAVSWGSSNSWSGIEEGTHTAYIRDNLGCEVSVAVVVAEFTATLTNYDALVEISNANALRYKKLEVWSTDGIRKNVLNTLSHEEDTKLNDRRFLQRFQKSDSIPTQIKSNYETNEAVLIDCDGTETELTVVQKTENLNISDVRDGQITISDEGNVSVYFTSGLTYDADTSLENGSYNTNGSLMDWLDVGEYMNLEGLGWVRINSISSPEMDAEYFVAVMNANNDSVGYTEGQTIKITSVYNVVDYERYEFTVNPSILDGNYYVKTTSTDNDFGTVVHISEWFNIQEIYSIRHHLVEWYSTINNEINYATGISFSARFAFARPLTWSPNTEQEIIITDTNTVSIDSSAREFYEMTLNPLPLAMAQKVVLILTHNRLLIDGLNYILEGEPEAIPIRGSNLYQIKASLVRSNHVFNNTVGLTAEEILIGAGVPLSIDENATGLLYIE